MVSLAVTHVPKIKMPNRTTTAPRFDLTDVLLSAALHI
jgi:hypothetical protein